MTQKDTTKPLQIFKPGQHRTMAGQALNFSESDLVATVNAYDPKLHEAPLVVGHPKADLPAYGWVESLAFCDGAIDATPAQVNADFADMVAAGAFKKISASFYSPDAPQNPVPGVYYLRHVGFLGAQAPAVKGLRNPSFAETEAGVVEFSEWDDATNASLWRRLREWFIGSQGADVADRVIPNYEVNALELGAQEEIREAAAALPATPLQFSEHQTKESTVTDEEAAQLRTQLEALQARNAALEEAQSAAASATAHAQNVQFCEAASADGRLSPAHVAAAVAALDHFSTLQSPVEFGEGEDRMDVAEGLRKLISGLPKVVEFKEFATNGIAADTVDFADPQSISDAATAYQADAQAKGQDITHAQAVAVITSNQSKSR